jgi:hypothetical protein
MMPPAPRVPRALTINSTDAAVSPVDRHGIAINCALNWETPGSWISPLPLFSLT